MILVSRSGLVVAKCTNRSHFPLQHEPCWLARPKVVSVSTGLGWDLEYRLLRITHHDVVHCILPSALHICFNDHFSISLSLVELKGHPKCVGYDTKKEWCGMKLRM